MTLAQAIVAPAAVWLAWLESEARRVKEAGR